MLRKVFGILAFSFFAFCNSGNSNSPEVFPVSLRFTSGESFTIQPEPNKALVLDFWATWCDPCEYAVPVVNRLQESLPPEKFRFLGINTDTEATVDVIYEKEKAWGMHYKSLLDKDWALVNKLHIEGQPALLVFDTKGKEIYRQYGITKRDLSGLLLRSQEWSK